MSAVCRNRPAPSCCWCMLALCRCYWLIGTSIQGGHPRAATFLTWRIAAVRLMQYSEQVYGKGCILTELGAFGCTAADRFSKFLFVTTQVFLRKEQLSLDVIKQCRVRCPQGQDKQRVLKEMILQNCDKLGQTIVFVRTKESARQLHVVVCFVA